jgi:flavin reductase (DIM6/NTAB) family NADH-FMN oxidoreductase RutF
LRAKSMNITSQTCDPATFRKTLGHFASGVTVITTNYGGMIHGMTANAFCSLSIDPPLVMVSIANRSRMHRMLTQSQHYGVSILAWSQEPLARHFAGCPQTELQIPFFWRAGCPLIDGSVAQLPCQLVATYPVGDHALYIGQVEYLEYSDETAPLLFYGGNYRALDDIRRQNLLG